MIIGYSIEPFGQREIRNDADAIEEIRHKTEQGT